VLILGGGIVGHNAAKVARGLGARVTVVDKNLNRLREIDDIFNGDVETMASSIWTIREAIQHADLVIGAVLIPGASTPRLVRRDMLGPMKRGAVIIDVSIDQGGCVETSRPTTHTDPVFFVDEVLHYCVSNMPAAVPHTSTMALTNATFPYLRAIASNGLKAACERSPAILQGVNTHQGHITYRAVAESQGRESRAIMELL
jgi:alanine dehydrogenase